MPGHKERRARIGAVSSAMILMTACGTGQPSPSASESVQGLEPS